MSKRYDIDPIKRALEHHTKAGAVASWLPPEEHAQGRWRVYVLGWGAVELTTAQAYALTLGLAAGQRAYSPLDLGGE